MPIMVRHTDRGLLETIEMGGYNPSSRNMRNASPAPLRCEHPAPEGMAIEVEMFLEGNMNSPVFAYERLRIRDHISKCAFCLQKAQKLSVGGQKPRSTSS